MPTVDPRILTPSGDLPPPLLALRTGIALQPLPHGRRILTLDLGLLGVATVLESPAPALTSAEWQCIIAARESYRHMWGSSDKVADTQDDPFDGRGAFAHLYHTTHYIATVVTLGKPDKIITMRKVAIHPNALPPQATDALPALVEDVGFWQVHDSGAGTAQPLGTVLQGYLEREQGLGPYPSPAHLPIAALSRSGTLPYERHPERHRDDRNRTAVAYALIQVAALLGDHATVFYAVQICEEFRTRAFALHLSGDSRVELDYPPTVHTLGLPADRTVVRLDRANPVIRWLLLNVPGFWLDNADLARLLAEMLDTGSLGGVDFAPASAELLASPDAVRLQPAQATLLQRLAGQEALTLPEVQAGARLLATPRLTKYLIGLLHTYDVLAARVLTDVGDGPYSSVLEPQRYWQSVLRLLRAARELYT